MNITGDVEMCRYTETAFPEPGEYVPQQIHIMPASASNCLCANQNTTAASSTRHAHVSHAELMAVWVNDNHAHTSRPCSCLVL